MIPSASRRNPPEEEPVDRPLERHAELLAALPELVQELERLVPRASFLLADDRSLAIRLDGARTIIAPPRPETGITLRIWDGGAFIERGTNARGPGEIRRWALEAASKVRMEEHREPPPDRPPCHLDFAVEVEIPPETRPV